MSGPSGRVDAVRRRAGHDAILHGERPGPRVADVAVEPLEIACRASGCRWRRRGRSACGQAWPASPRICRNLATSSASNSLQSFSSGTTPPANRSIEKASIGVSDAPATIRSATTAPTSGRELIAVPGEAERVQEALASCRSSRSPAACRAGIPRRPTRRGPPAAGRGPARPRQGGRGRARPDPAARSPCRRRGRPSPAETKPATTSPPRPGRSITVPSTACSDGPK